MLLTVREAADRAGVTERTIRRWLSSGRLKVCWSEDGYRGMMVDPAELAGAVVHEQTDNHALGGPPPPLSWERDRATHLVVGDAHWAPGQSMERAIWLARAINDHRPDVVVVIGDWYSMDSLCSHHSRREAEGHRVQADLEAGNEALQTLHDHLRHEPELHFCEGNHEQRLARLAEENPALQGFVGMHLYGFQSMGWHVHPYLQPARIDGIRYQHCLPTRGRAMLGGKYHAARMLDRVRYSESVTVGHSHRLQYRTEADHLGRRVHGLVAGCYFDHREGYAGEDNHEWWRGLLLCEGVEHGDYALRILPMSDLRRRYA